MEPQLKNPDLEASEKFELYRNPSRGWYCQIHCACGSTLSCGEWQTGPGSAYRAMADCITSVNRHWATSKKPICQSGPGVAVAS